MDSSWASAVASHVHEMGVAEAHGNRTHPSRRNRDAYGFEVREGHQAPGASEPIMSERVEDFTSRVLFCAAFAWGCSSAGRAPEWHSGGRRFDPVQLHHYFPPTHSDKEHCRIERRPTSGGRGAEPPAQRKRDGRPALPQSGKRDGSIPFSSTTFLATSRDLSVARRVRGGSDNAGSSPGRACAARSGFGCG